MGFMSKMAFKFDPMGKVKGIIKEWKPRKCKTEKDYEVSLFKCLEKKLPDIDVIRQFGIGRVKADISVGREIYIEIKNNLNSISKLQRLIGQLVLYEREKINNLIILVCGQVDKNIMSQLKREVEKYNNQLDLLNLVGGDAVIIMQK